MRRAVRRCNQPIKGGINWQGGELRFWLWKGRTKQQGGSWNLRGEFQTSKPCPVQLVLRGIGQSMVLGFFSKKRFGDDIKWYHFFTHFSRVENFPFVYRDSCSSYAANPKRGSRFSASKKMFNILLFGRFQKNSLFPFTK